MRSWVCHAFAFSGCLITHFSTPIFEPIANLYQTITISGICTNGPVAISLQNSIHSGIKDNANLVFRNCCALRKKNRERPAFGRGGYRIYARLKWWRVALLLSTPCMENS